MTTVMWVAILMNELIYLQDLSMRVKDDHIDEVRCTIVICNLQMLGGSNMTDYRL